MSADHRPRSPRPPGRSRKAATALDASIPPVDPVENASTPSTPVFNHKPTIIGGLPWVEFWRLANRVLDVMDPFKGTGHLYTPEEIDRVCKAREILAEELSKLLADRQTQTHTHTHTQTQTHSRSTKTRLPLTERDISFALSLGIDLRK